MCTPFEPLLVRFPFLPSPDSSHSEERRPHLTLDRFGVRSLAIALYCSPLLCYICRCFPLVWAVCLWAFPQAAIIIIILLSPLYLVFLMLMLIFIYMIFTLLFCLFLAWGILGQMITGLTLCSYPSSLGGRDRAYHKYNKSWIYPNL